MPRATAKGVMWMTLSEITTDSGPRAFTSSLAAQSVAASSASGSRSGRPSARHHAAIEARWISSGSEGHHSRSGKARAKAAACWPVPEPISSAMPTRPESQGARAAMIGGLLRRKVGEWSLPSGSAATSPAR